jgi:hypothetical protein
VGNWTNHINCEAVQFYGLAPVLKGSIAETVPRISQTLSALSWILQTLSGILAICLTVSGKSFQHFKFQRTTALAAKVDPSQKRLGMTTKKYVYPTTPAELPASWAI